MFKVGQPLVVGLVGAQGAHRPRLLHPHITTLGTITGDTLKPRPNHSTVQVTPHPPVSIRDSRIKWKLLGIQLAPALSCLSLPGWDTKQGGGGGKLGQNQLGSQRAC